MMDADKIISDHLTESEISKGHQIIRMKKFDDQPASTRYILHVNLPGESFKGHNLDFLKGPIGTPGAQPGVTNEQLLAVIIDRLEQFQQSEFSCRENAIAKTKCEEALMWLKERTKNRLRQGVEGTNQNHT